MAMKELIFHSQRKNFFFKMLSTFQLFIDFLIFTNIYQKYLLVVPLTQSFFLCRARCAYVTIFVISFLLTHTEFLLTILFTCFLLT